jgi:hypothetical protein
MTGEKTHLVALVVAVGSIAVGSFGLLGRHDVELRDSVEGRRGLEESSVVFCSCLTCESEVFNKR